ncbi:hypothetical protein [Anaerococcus sp. AGMB09787]|uniref:hypothetical protein n=1 Tax=Anaerococcus sp. AGMB09787 TaxID=2922869 RepID=UPI001FAFAEDC|nr:hypothetical protein [Anaerococcus sp. AGMB09787]
MSDSNYFAPGEYIEDAMYEDYAHRLGLVVGDYKRLLKGDLPIDKALADKLYKLTRVSAETWMNLQKRYDQRKKD